MRQVEIDESLLEGAVSLDKTDGWIRPWRLPFDRLRLFPPEDGIIERAGCAAGVRLRFRTDSSAVVVAFEPAGEERLFDLTIDGNLIETARAGAGAETVRFGVLPAGSKVVEIWLPQTHGVQLRPLRIEDDAALEPEPDGRGKWIAYGSSITQCAAAHSPARTWPAIVARAHRLNLTCLGYGGNCHLEPMVARMIRDMPADFISLKLGVNVQGGNTLSPRTFLPAVIGFVQIIREKHTEVPIAVVSPICSPPRETMPNAVGLSLTMMRQQLQQAVERLADCGDRNVYYFDGLQILGPDLAGEYLPDDVHPTADGYEVLGRNFSELVMEKIAL